jgi:16S rRNA (cytosine1402-N4)-methyltransferase
MEVHQTINQHSPVLLREVLRYLAPEKGDRLLDATAGYGGHAAAILEKTGQKSDHVLIDRDINSISELTKNFNSQKIKIIHSDFYTAALNLVKDGNKFDLILADLGVSSPHLDNADRGFSFIKNGPLDMRMDSSKDLNASVIVNEYSEEEISQILKSYSDEPRSKAIAKKLVKSRPINSTHQLANIVLEVYRGRKQYKIHPATKTFQALRIVVNDELNQLKQSLPYWVDLLNPGGRIAVISFHSLEDRIVKQYFKENSDHYEATLKVLTKKPVTGDENEIVFNPRARSAKLRVAVKK